MEKGCAGAAFRLLPSAFRCAVTEPLAYLNGELIAASQAAVPVHDAGFVLGATVTEQLRTFRGELFRLPEHLARLGRSLAIAGIQPREELAEIAEIAQRLVWHNWPLVEGQDDLGLCVFVTPGPYAPMAPGAPGQPGAPTVGIHTYRLPFHLWAEAYEAGVSLVTTGVRQVPTNCWPAELKCRSRMHYYLADRQASEKEPGARALLLDQQGSVSETATANVVAMLAQEGLVSPPRGQVLPGISLHVAGELAGRLGIRYTERLLTMEDLARADEIMLTSTPNCVLAVTRLNGRSVGPGEPGPTFRRILEAWSELVGLDVAGQARRYRRR